MTTLDDIRKIASRLPGATEGSERFGFSVEVKGKQKGFLWSWAERVHPKKARVINDSVIAVMVPSLMVKEMFLTTHPEYCFTEDHYNGYPAILVRLEDIAPEQMEPLIVEAWKCRAPKAAVEAYEEAEAD